MRKAGSVEVAVGRELDVLSAKDCRKFDVECRAGKAAELRVGTDSVCVKVGQRVRMDGRKKFGIRLACTRRKMRVATLRLLCRIISSLCAAQAPRNILVNPV